MPDRVFSCPGYINTQLGQWLPKVKARLLGPPAGHRPFRRGCRRPDNLHRDLTQQNRWHPLPVPKHEYDRQGPGARKGGQDVTEALSNPSTGGRNDRATGSCGLRRALGVVLHDGKVP